jgi:hypothetical protein
MATRNRTTSKTKSTPERFFHHSFDRLKCTADRIGSLKNKKVLDEILNVFLTDPAVAKTYTQTENNTVLFDLSIVSDKTVDEVIEILDREYEDNRRKIDAEPILLGPASSTTKHELRPMPTTYAHQLFTKTPSKIIPKVETIEEEPIEMEPPKKLANRKKKLG